MLEASAWPLRLTSLSMKKRRFVKSILRIRASTPRWHAAIQTYDLLSTVYIWFFPSSCLTSLIGFLVTHHPHVDRQPDVSSGSELLRPFLCKDLAWTVTAILCTVRSRISSLRYTTIDAGCTLVLLAWQEVSDVMPGPSGCLLTVLSPTPLLLAWQQVSDFMSCPARCLWLSSLPLWSYQIVSDFMPGPWAGCILTVLSPTPLLLAWQKVSDLCRSSWVPSEYSHSHSDPAGLTGSGWFHARSIWVPSDYSDFHSDPVGLTESEWFHAKCSWVQSDCSHS